jgi:hypothetical protein
MINTETGKEVRDRTVTISGEPISGIEESKNAKVRSGAKVVDGRAGPPMIYWVSASVAVV